MSVIKSGLKTFGIKKIPKVRFGKPYIKKVHGRTTLRQHVIDPNKVTFDLSFVVPESAVKATKDHVKRHKGKYIFGGNAGMAVGGGYVGTKYAMRKDKRR